MRQKNGMLVGIFSLVICVIIVMGVMTPIVSDWTTGERTENEGAGWLRMSYTSSPSYQSIAADLSGEGVVIYNDSDGTPEGTETLSGTEDTIIYADNNLALWYENDTLYLLGQVDGEPVFVQRNDAISLIRESDGIRVSATDTPTITFPFPTYAYEPHSNGNYGFFTNGTHIKTESGMPNAIIGGGNVGVYAYNNIYTYNGLGLSMKTVYDDDGMLYDAYWDKTSPVESQSLNPDVLDPSAINLSPMDIDLDPIVLNAGASLMAVPTPTYTSGEWGYDLMTIDDIQQAIIVSYSGSGGSIVIPSSIDNYPVHTIGKGGASQYILDNASISAGTTLTISEGIKKLNINAFRGLTNLSGTLVIPSSVVEIGNYCFEGCTGLSGTLTIPSNVSTIGIWAFRNTGISKLIVESNITEIPQSCFSNCTNLTEYILPDSVTSYGGSSFSYCSNLTDIKLDNIVNVGGSSFLSCTNYVGDLIIPTSVTTIGSSAFQNITHLKNVIVIPDSVTSLGSAAFSSCYTSKLIIATDSIPGSNCFSGIKAEVLDLSDTVDYSVNRYGMSYQSTFYQSIGDCFGYISFTEIGSDPKLTGPTATLLIAVPLLMVVGLTIAAMTMMRVRVQ